MQDQRKIALETWLKKTLLPSQFSLSPLAGDASFRRYFRVHKDNETFVVMDAPPNKENSRPFIAIAKAFAKQGIKVPAILAADIDLGFLLLTDLGDRLYLTELHNGSVNNLYDRALAIIPQIQTCAWVPDWNLPRFGEEIIVRELQLFPQWFLQKHLNLELDQNTQTMLGNAFAYLIQQANNQPQVCVHRDYHSRNLLCLANDDVGVLDFQDAVWGPITYDAVSLLRDCYIAWPLADVMRWVGHYYDNCVATGLLKNISKDQFIAWFDLMGIQRHLKVLGIFARLYHRDGKGLYLSDIPRILKYVIDVSENYTELKSLRQFLQASVLTQMQVIT